eukprot:6490697-Amphidinium_carterae.3
MPSVSLATAKKNRAKSARDQRYGQHRLTLLAHYLKLSPQLQPSINPRRRNQHGTRHHHGQEDVSVSSNRGRFNILGLRLSRSPSNTNRSTL